MKANYEDKIQKSTSEVTLGNLYDMNKQAMAQMDALDVEQRKEKINQLADYFQYGHPEEKYYMLLCNELRDYTLFNLDKINVWKNMPKENCSIAANDVIECMTNRGELLAIDQQPDGAWELWVRNSEGCFAYYLFPYGQAVLEY